MTEEIAAPEGGSVSASGEGSADGSSPTFIDSVTPSGIEVRYTWAPKRKYELRAQWEYDSNHPPEAQEGGQWKEVSSVTTVLDCLSKPGLTWWGMKMGVQGMDELAKRGYQLAKHTPDELIGLLTTEKLTVNHQRDKAGDRGVAVHDSFETWCKTGLVPDPTMFPEEEAGYVAGIVKFLRDVEPEPQAAEIMVGSLRHGYAGRYDARVYISRKCEVVCHVTDKSRRERRATLAPGTLLVDLKTSSDVYETHGEQLAAYEQASVECGYGPSDARGVLHVFSDGLYELVRADKWASFDDFKTSLEKWRSLQSQKKRRQAENKRLRTSANAR